jgi:hypothetical protein
MSREVVRADKGVIKVRLPFREELLRHDGTDWSTAAA